MQHPKDITKGMTKKMKENYEQCQKMIADSLNNFSYEISPECKKKYKGNCVNSVTFDIGRYGKNKKTLKFKNPKTIVDAIHRVEKYFNRPMKHNHYNKLKESGDLFDENTPFENYKTNGSACGDAYFIEDVYLNKEGNLKFAIGS